MALSAGARLGPYEIIGPIGAGGMGEVYKAKDTRLDRIVAVKILPEALAADPHFRDRFDREARAISQLDHPNICALYDVGNEHGTAYLVMQYLEGETLANRLTKGALPLEQALTRAIEIASALDKAHRAGIVHRDLKPGNVMLTKSGAKLLDFGLAKASKPVVASAALSMLPTTPPNLTLQGTILGTFQYMAPEQLEGKETDSRTDIFAFGAVVYEMVTGTKAFEGKSQASLISAIMSSDPPPIAASQPLTPAELDHVVRMCLAKDAEARWQSASDLKHELQWVAEGAGAAGTPVGARKASRGRLPIVSAALGLLVGALTTTLGSRFLRPPAGTAAVGVTRAVIGIAPADQLRSLLADTQGGEGRPSRTALALSPDGRLLVFSAVRAGHQSLYARGLEKIDATPIPGTEDGLNPFFSPDGTWIGFWANGALKKAPLSGGPPTTICESGPIFGASWASTNTIVFGRQREGLLQVSAAGGPPHSITALDAKRGEVSHRLPFVLPGGAAVVFTVTHHSLPRWQDARLAVLSIATGERKDLGPGADARYVPTGHLVFMQAGTLVAAPFDLARLGLTGGPVSLIDDVMQAGRTITATIDTGAGQFSTSSSGTLVYVPGGLVPAIERTLVWVDRRGVSQPLALPVGPYWNPMLSPDGRHIVLWTGGDDRNVWLDDVERQTLTRLTSEGRNSRAIWTPDGRRVAFSSATAGVDNLFWKAADGSGAAERLTTSTSQQAPSSWSPDGKTLAFLETSRNGDFDIWALSSEGDRQPHPILQTRFNETYAEFSPDGRWIAYVSDESGRDQVYVQPYPGPGPRMQISNDGGTQPAWSRTGRELFYTDYVSGSPRAEMHVMVVPVILTPTLSAGTAHELFRGPYAGQGATRGYDVTHDGQRFLMLQSRERPPIKVTQVILVQNWFEELKQHVPAK
jgi:Tol biopolymer transport system component